MRLLNRIYLLLTLAALLTCQVAQGSTKTITYFHTDALGSVVAASDEQAEVIWRKSYDPYGYEVIDTGSEQEVEEQTFSGKPYDDETGLVYLGQRYYDPQLRRFMGVDSIGFRADNPTSFNRYTYANNNPYRYVDPDGRQSICPATICGFSSDMTQAQVMAGSQRFRVVTGTIGAGGAVFSAAAVAPGVALLGGEGLLLVGTRFPTLTGVATELTAAEIGATTGGALLAAKGALPIIRGTQRGGLDNVTVDKLVQDMLNGTFDFKALKGQIGGFRDAAGRFHIGEGHNRIAAAREILKNTGNSEPLRKLLQNGRFDPIKNAPANSRPLPSRSLFESFRNYIGF